MAGHAASARALPADTIRQTLAPHVLPGLLRLLQLGRILVHALRERIRRRPLLALLASHAASGALLAALVRAVSRTRPRLELASVGRAASALRVGTALSPPAGGPAAKRVKPKMRAKIEKMVVHKGGAEPTRALPARGAADADVLGRLARWSAEERTWRDGRLSGTVYGGDERVTELAAGAMRAYAHANPLRPDAFPSVRRMEAEVVSMVNGCFNGPEEACGTMASGGTEAILLACKAYRDHARATRGVTEPSIVLPCSAHAAFLKAAHVLRMRCVRVPVDRETFRADVGAMARAIDDSTVLLVGSAPCYPQGVVDPIVELAVLAREHGVGLHVDCALGSLLVALMPRMGRALPPCDFQVEGVTSISCGLHTYGFAPQGCAVALYSNEELRHHQYFVASDWAGGIYATPTLAGSRSGALVAGAWAVLVGMGEDGYTRAFEQILHAAGTIARGVEGVRGLRLLGRPDASVVCFGAASSKGDRHVDMFALGEAMGAKGWALGALQHPPALHVCVGLAHAAEGVAERFVADLRTVVDSVETAPPSELSAGRLAGGALHASRAGVHAERDPVPEDAELAAELACCFVDALYKVSKPAPPSSPAEPEPSAMAVDSAEDKP